MNSKKIAISNIAWKSSEEKKVFEIMRRLRINYLEISPKKLWTNPFDLNDNFIIKTIKTLRGYNINLIAMQALLYQRPDLTIFEDIKTRKKTLQYLINMILLGSKLGVKNLIFGSPKNKLIGKLSVRRATEIAIEFFSSLGKEASGLNMCFCIEPTPKIYGADFICNTNEALGFIKKVNSKGLKLNLDLGSMILNREPLRKTIKKAAPYMAHFHISEPYLKTINLGESFHKIIADQLQSIDYKGCVSIEMLAHKDSNIELIDKILFNTQRIYGVLD